MAKLYYYRHIIGDYDRDTKDLELLEHGAYRRLMDAYYANRGPIRAKPENLFRLTGAFKPEEQAATLYVAELFFIEQDGLLHNDKCDTEIARVLAESERQSAAATARWKGNAKKAAETPPPPQAEAASQDAAASAPAVPPASPMAPQEPPAPPEVGLNGAPPTKKKGARAPKPPSQFVLPEWIPQPEWDEFMALRVVLRRPPSDGTKARLVKTLSDLRDEGSDPRAVLGQSIEQSWVGLFPVKSRRARIENRNQSSADAWAEEVTL